MTPTARTWTLLRRQGPASLRITVEPLRRLMRLNHSRNRASQQLDDAESALVGLTLALAVDTASANGQFLRER